MPTPDQSSRKVQSGLLSLEVLSGPDTQTLQLQGELDLATAAIVETALGEALAGDSAKIVIDLSQLTFIDSTGIAILIAAMCSEGGREVRFVASRAPAVNRVLRLTGVEERMKLSGASDS